MIMATFLLVSVLFLAVLQLILASEDNGTDRHCGTPASTHLLHQDPWLAFLEYYRRGQLTEIRCAGTLISTRHVLTAAHCVSTVKYNRLQVRLGEYDLRTAQECIGGVCVEPTVHMKVDRVTVHSGFNGTEHDIAVIHLAEEAPFTDFIRPVCLPSGELDLDTIFHAAGWGEVIATGLYSNVKKSIPLPYWSYEDCMQAYKHDQLPSHAVCAGGKEGIDTCRGDSGGPLMRTSRRVEIWGVTSLGSTRCGREGKPGIYTSVMDHIDWVKEAADLE